MPAGLLRFLAPLVTQPEKIRSIMRVDRAESFILLKNCFSNDGIYNFTVVIVSGKIVLINEQIMITIQFPKFAINYVKVFVTEIGHNLIDIFFLFQQLKDLVLIEQYFYLIEFSTRQKEKFYYLQ